MRSFIAIEVPFTKEMESLQNSIDGRVKLVERENVHITLKFLGEIDEKTFEMVRQIVEDCKVGSFNITLRGVGFFPNERYVRVVWIGVDNYEPIERMARCIDEKLKNMGFQREKSYVPHLTVARARGRITIRNLEKFKNMRFAEMEVKEIKIKKSTLTPNGPVYEDLATIQL